MKILRINMLRGVESQNALHIAQMFGYEEVARGNTFCPDTNTRTLEEMSENPDMIEMIRIETICDNKLGEIEFIKLL